ncbi:MAG: hypothetical protein ABFD69_17050 [Candidatus Sumerlaeia bacterium]
MKRFIFVGLGLMWLCGCSGSADRIESSRKTDATPAPETTPAPAPILNSLQMAASETYRKYMTAAVGAGAKHPATEIPPAYWADAIKELKPIRVYTHRVNIVVVQRVNEEVEEGKYIYIPISSYLPENGVDGFTVTPNPHQGNTYQLGTGVFDYSRRLK